MDSFLCTYLHYVPQKIKNSAQSRIAECGKCRRSVHNPYNPCRCASIPTSSPNTNTPANTTSSPNTNTPANTTSSHNNNTSMDGGGIPLQPLNSEGRQQQQEAPPPIGFSDDHSITKDTIEQSV